MLTIVFFQGETVAIKFWFVSFVVLFVLAQIYLWAVDSILSPISLLGGAILAIASNYEKGITSSFSQPRAQKPEVVIEVSVPHSVSEEIEEI